MLANPVQIQCKIVLMNLTALLLLSFGCVTHLYGWIMNELFPKRIIGIIFEKYDQQIAEFLPHTA